jgi:hypothetical protein
MFCIFYTLLQLCNLELACSSLAHNATPSLLVMVIMQSEWNRDAKGCEDMDFAAFGEALYELVGGYPFVPC